MSAHPTVLLESLNYFLSKKNGEACKQDNLVVSGDQAKKKIAVPGRHCSLLRRATFLLIFFRFSLCPASIKGSGSIMILLRRLGHLSTQQRAWQHRSLTTSTTATRGWKKYVHQFKDKPASYITSFAILHELTAIAPFPFIYYALSWSDIKVPVPEQALTEGNKIINKVRGRYGYEPLAQDDQTMVHLAVTYAIVKAMLPLRIGVSVAMTPFVAEKWIGPVAATFRSFFKRKHTKSAS
ncbi:hypothetical protein DM01DRAFT_1333087 [Hesseltinella vesiculosa]|uniref:DUF1279 domain-containing protein n=1 Tax=Hesseltinella vesiculosa TaxID=101127 RepID=A0A1X2GRA6_9FUNG|nr:hypothetical protein DM01DRAFT_1333087 [Hesseltinella vesiculosa]